MKRRLAFLYITLFIHIGVWAGNVIDDVRSINPSTVEVLYANGKTLTIDFYDNNIFRLFKDDNGGVLRDPIADPPAQILVDNPRKPVGRLQVKKDGAMFSVSTPDVMVVVNESDGLLRVIDTRRDKLILQQSKEIEFGKNGYVLTWKAVPGEYFYGGGVQNGRFSHRGESIEIVNTNSWTDGGVSSPAPFYWSTSGYAILCHTFSPGVYDFCKKDKEAVCISHNTDYLDIFVMVDSAPEELLRDYYQLTGNPVLLPKFGFYEGHLNAYNRDFWKESSDEKRGVLFEDGKYYEESQKDNGGIKESLNGELEGSYQFSARAVIDRYKKHDMPLGWVLPNDGYATGYGQTETIDGNIANLKRFGDYAHEQGVEIGLWTQSNLHPVPDVSALLQRDIVKEVRDAGVRVLKTDVAWVGAGYSFGLNGIADVAQVMPYYGNAARPFIISVDGWAGTQRYAGIWTGDQTGGEWEYIRFHIPTYIGAGLSGIGNITSDMDGIFGGRNVAVNVRDFQWKTFSPMQLNMDGWGSNAKYPHALGEPAASINRSYLKLKSMLLPYTYSVSYQAIGGMPLIRAMFLDYPNRYTYGKATRYQYMYGPYFLVAPIYQETNADANGNDLRNGIYLPEGKWIDYFDGKTYEGNRVINSFDAPIWKLPVFVKLGAIIPMSNPSNNPSEIDPTQRIYEVYPSEELTSFIEYDDDGKTDAYLKGEYTLTRIESKVEKNRAVITINPTEGEFEGMQKSKATKVIVNLAKKPKKVIVRIDGKKTFADWDFVEAPELNRFATPGSDFAHVHIQKNPQLIVNVGPTSVYNRLSIEVLGYEFLPMFNKPEDNLTTGRAGILSAPNVKASEISAYSLTPSWDDVEGADYYEILFDSMLYSTIRATSLTFNDLQPESDYHFSVRAVGGDRVSEWTELNATTSADPYQFALRGVTAICTAEDMPGLEIGHLFDFAEKGELWHTHYNKKAVPFDMTIDLHAIANVDRIDYVPRENAGNGTILKGSLSVSLDGKTWGEPTAFSWTRNNMVKTQSLLSQPVRYLKLHVDEAVGDFGSGAELYVYYQAGSKIQIPGDINQDGKIDDNDLTSYLNYTGLRRGDSDFDGYVSKGDVNYNGIIDAQDISEVATRLDGGVYGGNHGELCGQISMISDKQVYRPGEEIILTVTGKQMQEINALSMIIPYNESEMQFVSIEPKAVSEMKNMTNDRLHSNGDKVLYPTFVNIGNQHTLADDAELFVIHFKALRPVNTKTLKMNGMLVDKSLNTKNF
jgi:hypothetical protein